ncbi:MAG: helix-turn-helix transcriptional regulator [Bacteroidales bacterium]|jgi:y4mF family transcriptional regulator|nr:helix-turn-helix transcriptional regulator [Bacteroidales bacterium]MBQ3355311.1 helix-turn-helix transcriptional regulator [Bacteroidales bacterium]MBQ6101970.1 helix-turn-helix transcriptional regulator [Bacteroidales bacterium]
MKKSTLTETVKRLRKQYGLTQEQLALKSGVGLNFIREMEQGKATVRLDKVNQVLLLFNYEMAPMPRKDEQ